VSTCQDADQNPITSSLNVWIQSGSYLLIAFSEIFASITGLEYAFTKAPSNMKSLVMAMFLFTSAVASAIGEALNREWTINCGRRLIDLDDSLVDGSTARLELWYHGRLVWHWRNPLLVLLPSAG